MSSPIAQLMEMGFSAEAVTTAVNRFSGDMTKCVEFLTGDMLLDNNDEPPPLIVADDAVPAYGPKNVDWAAPKSKSNVIDLCSPPSTPRAEPLLLTNGPGPGAGDGDLERAVRESLVSGGIGGSKEDEEMGKAMELSMASLKSADDDVGALASTDPKDRKRLDSTRPVALRSLSPHFSGLAAYFMCLYAVPVWRQTILDFRPAEDEYPGRKRTYQAVWSGKAHKPARQLRDNGALLRILDLQRLFALMEMTTRSYLHISEMEEAFEAREHEWRSGDTWPTTLKDYHELLVRDLCQCADDKWKVAVANSEMTAVDKNDRLLSLGQLFMGHGRQVTNNRYLPLPLPPAEPIPFTIFDVNIVSVQENGEPDNLFAALDRQMITRETPFITRETPFQDDSPELLSLLTKAPETLLLQFSRGYEASAGNALSSDFDAGVANGKLFKLEKQIWLDRYSIGKRKEVQVARTQVVDVEKKLEVLRQKKRELTLTKESQDAFSVVSDASAYLQRATSSDPKRARSQRKLAQYSDFVLKRMKQRLTELDAEIDALEREKANVWETPEMREVGPYNLVSLLMRNGLNGRGSAWSVVRDEDGRWWKTVDFVQTEVQLDEALSDKSGVFLRAGLTFAFYQREDRAVAEPTIPHQLRLLAEQDNESFARELAGETDFASVDAPEYSSDSTETEPLLACPPDYYSYTSHEAGHEEDVFVEHSSVERDPMQSWGGDDTVHVEHAAETPMSVATDPDESKEEDADVVVLDRAVSPLQSDLDMAEASPEDESSDQEVGRTLGLRGGASEGDASMGLARGEEDDVDDDEGLDEDEVELGTLAPMPPDWNIDRAVGKVGGLPRWLDPRSPLRQEDVRCTRCGAPMALLLLLNSPDDSRPHAAARTLYVFACRQISCRGKGGDLRVYRSQTTSPNIFFPPTAESEAHRKALEGKLDPASYLADSSASSAPPFAEWDIQCEPEPYEESFLPDPADKLSEEDGSEDAAEPDSATGVDREFLKFQERVSRLPEQILRFYRLPEVEQPEPIWVSSRKVASSEIPSCPLCGQQRQVEFQIISTLLSYLKDSEFNFDTLLVYTCAANCAIPDDPPLPGFSETSRSGWAEEVVMELEFATDGVRFGGGK